MSMAWKRYHLVVLLALLMGLTIHPALAQESKSPETDGSESTAQFGGPGSVTGQLAEDAEDKESLTGLNVLERYFEWKGRLSQNNGFAYTLDYTAGYLTASKTKGEEDSGASGAVRFLGSWALIGRDSGNTGSFIWKVENRHKYTTIPASGVASEIGYAGAILPILSDMGTRLTNLYWKQNLNKNRLEVILGFLDTTDWVDLYALASPWNGFFNFAFATGGASIPVPDDSALGLYVNAMLSDNIYVIGGLADSNANSTDPFNGFDSLFNQTELFKTIELGWTSSQDRFYLDNRHITFWHADERKNAGVSSGWGATFSFAHAFAVKWMPFVRGGYAEDGGSVLQKTLSTGLGYHLADEKSLLGLAFNWGQPNEGTFGSGLRDQFATELFCRLQMGRNFELTPDIQLISNPALHPDKIQSWVFGLRARVFI